MTILPRIIWSKTATRMPDVIYSLWRGILLPSIKETEWPLTEEHCHLHNYLWLAWQKPETTLEKSLAPRVPLPWTNVHSSFILRAKCFVRGEVRHTWPPLLHTHPQQGLSTDRGKWPAYHNLALIHDGFKKSRNLYAVKPNLQAAERWQAIATVFHSQGHDYPEECSIHWRKSQYQLYAFLPNP